MTPFPPHSHCAVQAYSQFWSAGICPESVFFQCLPSFLLPTKAILYMGIKIILLKQTQISLPPGCSPKFGFLLMTIILHLLTLFQELSPLLPLSNAPVTLGSLLFRLHSMSFSIPMESPVFQFFN